MICNACIFVYFLKTIQQVNDYIISADFAKGMQIHTRIIR